MAGYSSVISHLAQRVEAILDISRRWNAAREIAKSRPLTTIFLVAISALITIPVATFVFVVGASIFVGLTALFCIEGTILMIATAFLFLVLSVCLLCAAALVFFAHASHRVWTMTCTVWQALVGGVWPSMPGWRITEFNIMSRVSIPSMSMKFKHRKRMVGEDGLLAKGDHPRAAIEGET